jgi:hypothetical protein
MRKLGNLNRFFSLWLLSNIDPHTMQIDLGGGEFLDVSAEAIGRALGVSSSGDVVDMRTPANKVELLVQAHAMLGTRVPRANNVPVAKLRSIIQDAGEALLSESEKMRQMTAYSMIAAATFLLPRGGNPKVPDQVLGISLSPAEIHRFNIAHMVAEGLRESARKVHETLPLNPGTITIDGCHLVLQVPLFSLFPKQFFFPIFDAHLAPDDLADVCPIASPIFRYCTWTGWSMDVKGS